MAPGQNASKGANPWLDCVHVNRAATRRLFCFSHAGGAAGFFANWWRKLPADLEVCPIQLPGRWSRIDEEPISRFSELVDQVILNLADEFASKPFLFYGHSLGGLIAFETAARLRACGADLPDALFISSTRPPDAGRRRWRPAEMDDAALLRAVGDNFEPVDPRILAEPEFRSSILRVLRADMSVYSDYQLGPREPLELPFFVFAARADDYAPPSAMEGWRKFCAVDTQILAFDGAHFFLRDSAEFWRVLPGLLQQV